MPRGPREIAERAGQREPGGALHRVDEPALPVEEGEPRDERRVGEEGLHRARHHDPAPRRRLQAPHHAVLRVAERHVDLVRDHHRHAPRLLAEQLVRRPLPLSERVIAEDGQEDRRDDDGEEREGGEADQRRDAGASHPGSARRRRIIPSVSS